MVDRVCRSVISPGPYDEEGKRARPDEEERNPDACGVVTEPSPPVHRDEDQAKTYDEQVVEWKIGTSCVASDANDDLGDGEQVHEDHGRAEIVVVLPPGVSRVRPGILPEVLINLRRIVVKQSIDERKLHAGI